MKLAVLPSCVYQCVYILYMCMTFILIVYVIQDTISGFKKIIDGESVLLLSMYIV